LGFFAGVKNDASINSTSECRQGKNKSMRIEKIIPSFSILFLIIAWSPAQPAEKITVS
jgi:hypothetical protein